MSNAISIASWAVASVGAINWGLVELTETNLIVDTLALDPGPAGIAYILIAIAGLINLYDLVMEVAD